MAKKFTLDDFKKDRTPAGDKIKEGKTEKPQVDGTKAINHDVKTASNHDGTTSRRHDVTKRVKSLTVRLKPDLYSAWIRYEMENKIQGNDISFQGLIEDYLTRKLKGYMS